LVGRIGACSGSDRRASIATAALAGAATGLKLPQIREGERVQRAVTVPQA